MKRSTMDLKHIEKKLLSKLSANLGEKDRHFFHEECSELHPPNDFTIDDLWRPLITLYFPENLTQGSVEAFENIFFILLDNDCLKTNRWVYASVYYVHACRCFPSGHGYFPRYLLNTLRFSVDDRDLFGALLDYLVGVDSSDGVISDVGRFYIRIAICFMKGFEGELPEKGLLLGIEETYSRRLSDALDNDWLYFWDSVRSSFPEGFVDLGRFLLQEDSI